MDNYSKYAPMILRYGLALVFLWFGISQLLDPEMWIGYLPGFLQSMSNPSVFIYANAVFEIVASILLIFGIWTRWVSGLLALHLAGITATIGLTSVGVRDFGLTIAAFALAFYGSDDWCLENKWKKSTQ